MSWLGLLAAHDVPEFLRKPACLARVSALAFAVVFVGWIAAMGWLAMATAPEQQDRRMPVLVAALAMGLVGATHTSALTALRLRAATVAFKRGCRGCGHSLNQGDLRFDEFSPRSKVCPECGLADDRAPLPPTVRDVWPGPRARIAGVDTPLGKLVSVTALLAGLWGVLGLLGVFGLRIPGLVLPGLANLAAGGRVPSALALGCVMFAFNASAVFRTLSAMIAPRRWSPR